MSTEGISKNFVVKNSVIVYIHVYAFGMHTYLVEGIIQYAYDRFLDVVCIKYEATYICCIM